MSFILLSFLVGYFFGRKNSVVCDYTNSCPAINKIPECFMGHCPSYELSWDTDGDGKTETLIKVPTAMNKETGEIWVIKNGEIVFKTNEYGWINAMMDQEKVYITYISKWRDGVHPEVFVKDELIYENSQYKLVNISKENNI